MVRMCYESENGYLGTTIGPFNELQSYAIMFYSFQNVYKKFRTILDGFQNRKISSKQTAPEYHFIALIIVALLHWNVANLFQSMSINLKKILLVKGCR